MVKKKDTKLEAVIEKDEKEARIESLEDQLKRAVADYKNLERRFEEERRETIKYANRELVINLLPALDALFLAGKFTEDQGIKLTIQRIIDILKENGIEKVETENVKYNAQTMECIEVLEGNPSTSSLQYGGQAGQEDMVLEEVRPGFMINGKLIRPAQVKVGRGGDK